MELKLRLIEYRQHEFLSFVEDIWNVESSQQQQNQLILHFDKIIGHPAGSDLLFYSEAAASGNVNSPGSIVHTIKAWHQRKGQAAFKDQTSPPLPPVRQTLTREQRAVQTATRNLERVRTLAAEIQAGERDFKHKAALLEQALAPAPDSGTPAQQLTAARSLLRALEAAQYQAKRAIGVLERLSMTTKFALDAAKRDIKSTFSNPAIQAVVLREMTAANQQHTAALAEAQTRHPPLYSRCVALINRLEAQVSRLARATQSGPGYDPLTLNASARAASLYPQLLTAQGLNAETATYQRALIKTFRSAVAELEWQATSLQDDHTGTYADVLEFVLSTPSDDPRFAMTVPLAQMHDIELDWRALAAAREKAPIPIRLCSTVTGPSTARLTGIRPATRYSHVLMASTPGEAGSGQVRVRAAQWSASRQSYTFTSEGQAPITLVWQTTPAACADDAISRPPSVGYLNMPSVPRIETFSDVAQVQFDDYIVVFPEDSGLAPLYVMFRDRREL